MNQRIHGIGILCSLALQLAASAPAAAQDHDDSERAQGAGRTAESAQAGMFLPLTEAPRTDTQRAFAATLGGYDGARESGVLEGRGEVTVYGPLALRVGVLYTQSPERLRPTVGARVQALSQTDHAIDMSIGAFYKPEGFTEAEGEVEAVLAFGRRFGRLGLFADLAYGQDPEGRERDGEVRLATLYAVMQALQLGFDSRVRFDLGSDEEKRMAEGEAEYDVVAGPLLTYTLDPIAIGVQAGLSVVGTQRAQAGPVALAMISGSM